MFICKVLKSSIKNSPIFLLIALLTACDQENGKIEHYLADDSNIKVSEMLLIEKPLEESSKQKQFLQKFEKDRTHFKLDQYDISHQDREYLEKVCEHLMINLDLKIEVQGNCDKRGSIDYNNALGMKRANSIVQFLKQKGITDDRINAVSFGSRILVEGDDEEAYAKNRVAIIVLK